MQGNKIGNRQEKTAGKGGINQWIRILSKERLPAWLYFLPMLIALIGYGIYYHGNMPFALYSSLRIYVLEADFEYEALVPACVTASPGITPGAVTGWGLYWLMRVCLEVGRFGGALVTGSFLLQAVRKWLLTRAVLRQARRLDSVALYGEEQYIAPLARELGDAAITADTPEKEKARRHVFACSSDEEAMKAFSAFREKQLQKAALSSPVTCYLCLHDLPASTSGWEGIHLCSMSELCAYDYWKRFFLKRYQADPARNEEMIVILGSGQYGLALLNEALLINVFPPELPPVCWTVIGDERLQAWQALHQVLADQLEKDSERTGKPLLTLSREPWTQQLDLIRKADRIILAEDEDQNNLAALRTLLELGTSAAIHIRARSFSPVLALFGDIEIADGDPEAKVSVFGTTEKLYTAETIFHESRQKRGKLVAAHYEPIAGMTAAEQILTPGFQKHWEEMDSFYRESNFASADHIDIKIRSILREDAAVAPGSDTLVRYASRLAQRQAENPEALLEEMEELEHRRWVRFYQYKGWTHGTEKSLTARTHPLLIPFEQLTAEDKVKDLISWDMIQDVCDEENAPK